MMVSVCSLLFGVHNSVSFYYIEGSPSNPEIVQLHQAIVDLDLQIEEQKMKIETTANSVLRVREGGGEGDPGANFYHELCIL